VLVGRASGIVGWYSLLGLLVILCDIQRGDFLIKKNLSVIAAHTRSAKQTSHYLVSCFDIFDFYILGIRIFGFSYFGYVDLICFVLFKFSLYNIVIQTLNSWTRSLFSGFEILFLDLMNL
jgi:hypothetical protein